MKAYIVVMVFTALASTAKAWDPAPESVLDLALRSRIRHEVEFSGDQQEQLQAVTAELRATVGEARNEAELLDEPARTQALRSIRAVAKETANRKLVDDILLPHQIRFLKKHLLR